MSTKKGFFERLTGSMKIEDELPEEKVETKQKDFIEEEETEVAPEKISKKEAKEEIFEEAPGEAEGRLTIDVYQTPTEIVIKSTIAGVSAENLDITITNDMVTIKGARKNDEIVKSEDYYYQECYWGSFSRSIILPLDVEAEKAKASLKNGILTIRLPKIEKVKTKKIKIETE